MACDYANAKWNPYTINFINKAGYSDSVSIHHDGNIVNMRDQSVQEKYIKAFLSDREITSDVLERVLELNREYSKQIKHTGDVSRNIVWKLKKMKWNNLFNYGESNEIDFDKLNGLVGIFGKNYSGKSSIIDAALFGLFNTTSKGERKNVHIVNQNREKAKCQLEIGVGDDTYKITRNLETYKKKIKGREAKEVKTELDFTKYALGQHAESKNGTTRNETDEVIRKTFGNYNDFMITSMASQMDAFGFINEGSTKRKEILAKFLDLKMFEEKHKLAKKESAEMKGVLKHLNTTDWRKKLKWNQEALSEILEDIADQADLCEKHTARIKDLLGEQKLIEDQISAVGTDSIDVRTLLDMLKTKRKVHWKSNKTIEKGLDRLSAQEGLQQQLQASVGTFDLESREELVEKHKSLRNDLLIIERHIRTDTMKMNNFQNKIDLLHDHEYDPDCKYCCDNQFVKEAEEAKTLIEKVHKSIRDFEEDLRLIKKKKNAIDIVYIEAEITDHNVRVREVKTNEVKIKSIKSEISANESKKALAEKEIEETLSKIEHYYKNQEAYDNLESLQRDLKAIRLTVGRKKLNLDDCNTKVMKLMSEEGSTRRLIEEAREHIGQINAAEKEFIAYDLYIQAMHANGVSYQVIRSMLSIINKEISSVLNTIVDFEVFFDNVDNKLEIYIKHSKYDPRPLSMGSGAEKTIASMAIRLALISITNLPKSELFILDEPATALDEEHMEGFVRLLQMIKGQFKTVLLISHLESLKDIVDMTIDIQKVDGYAKVKI